MKKHFLFALFAGFLFAFAACHSGQTSPQKEPVAALENAPVSAFGEIASIPAFQAAPKTAWAQVGPPETPDDPNASNDGFSIVALWAFFKTNWGQVLAAFAALVAVVEAVVRLTPTEKDNSWFNRLKTFLDRWLPNARAGGGLHP